MSDAPQLLHPGDGEEVRPGFHIKVARPELVMTEFHYAAGEQGPPPHIHKHHADAFYVLAGRLEYYVADTTRILEPGAFVLLPPLLVHTFRNPGPDPAHALNVHAPGLGFEEYLRGRKPDFDQFDDPGEGDWLPASAARVVEPGGDAVKAGPGDALGSFTLEELDLGPGGEGDGRSTSVFYVLAGQLALDLGLEAATGDLVSIPPGNPHRFSGSGRILRLRTPDLVSEIGSNP
jgi:quercetin dioxygenase-like cupin family protein